MFLNFLSLITFFLVERNEISNQLRLYVSWEFGTWVLTWSDQMRFSTDSHMRFSTDFEMRFSTDSQVRSADLIQVRISCPKFSPDWSQLIFFNWDQLRLFRKGHNKEKQCVSHRKWFFHYYYCDQCSVLRTIRLYERAPSVRITEPVLYILLN